MPRPKKKKNNMEELSQQVLEAVTDAYLNPTEDTADENGKMSLNVLAGEFSMSRIKLRKLLITSGVYETPISRKVNEFYNSGKTVKEIQTITGLSAASVSGYLPYQKTIYNLEESTLVAERLRKYRNRKAAVHQLAKALENGDLDNIKETLWNALVTFEGYPFKTAKGLQNYLSILNVPTERSTGSTIWIFRQSRTRGWARSYGSPTGGLCGPGNPSSRIWKSESATRRLRRL